MNRRRYREIGDRRAVLGHHRQHLLDEERIALGRSGDPSEHRRADLGIPAQKLEQRLRLRLGERLQPDLGRRSASKRTSRGGGRGAPDGRGTRSGSAPPGSSRRGTRSGRGRSARPTGDRRSPTITGRSRAMRSSRRRTAHMVSSRMPTLSEIPIAPATRAAMRARVLLALEELFDPLAREVARRLRTMSRSGQYVIPSPYGRHRPDEDGRFVADARQQLIGQPGLADSGRADDGDEPAGAVSARLRRRQLAARRARAPGRPSARPAGERTPERQRSHPAAARRSSARPSPSAPSQRPALRERRRARAARSRSPMRISPGLPLLSSRWATATASPVANA